jgi:putative transposase
MASSEFNSAVARRTPPLLPMGWATKAVTHDYVRHRTTALFAAFKIANGSAFTQCKPRHRHQEFVSFLPYIEASVPPTLEVHLICYNYARHQRPRVRSWPAHRLRCASICTSLRPKALG